MVFENPWASEDTEDDTAYPTHCASPDIVAGIYDSLLGSRNKVRSVGATTERHDREFLDTLVGAGSEARFTIIGRPLMRIVDVVNAEGSGNTIPFYDDSDQERPFHVFEDCSVVQSELSAVKGGTLHIRPRDNSDECVVLPIDGIFHIRAA